MRLQVKSIRSLPSREPVLHQTIHQFAVAAMHLADNYNQYRILHVRLVEAAAQTVNCQHIVIVIRKWYRQCLVVTHANF